ncbi:MAG: tetratricopeptide repeat protein [Flammeovirgaceae bacterium]|nr:tetratricopeptide repeat protein [Flammeovirgaceae bacterium]
MRRLIYTLIFALLSFNLWSQSSTIATLFQSNERKAELQYSHLAYRNALELYLIVYEKDTTNIEACSRIADCYLRLGEMDHAENWYAKLVTFTDHDPEFEYLYAQVLSIQGKYGDAEKWFQQYYKRNTADKRAKEKYEFMYLISYYYRDSTLYEIKNLELNSDQSDFAPQYYKEGIAFVSARDWNFLVKRQSTSALNDKEQMLNIFHTTDSTSNVSLFYHKDINSNFHDGPISFYDNGNHVAFTRSNLDNGKPVHHSGKVKLKLFFGRLNESGELSHIEPFPYNDDAFSIGHPTVSNDGKILYFSSDMPGGIGGADIYRSLFKDGKWGMPENVGTKINTLGDEFFPHIVNDTIIYFSSNGHGGLGGLDLYYSHTNGNTYQKPENLGFPLNSSTDDFSLIFDSSGRQGLFASNRPGGRDMMISIVSKHINFFWLEKYWNGWIQHNTLRT